MTTDTTEEKMDPEIKAKWVTALRSGEYEQGKGKLRRHQPKLVTKGWWVFKKEKEVEVEGFCCLGVLANIVDPTKWSYDGENWYAQYSYDGWNNGWLPPTLAKSLNIYDCQRILSAKNDDGQSFEEIADWIEENL